MKKRQWKTRLKKAVIEAKTYKPFFDYTIDTLAGILEQRDEVYKLYTEDEDGPVVEYTNKAGFTNSTKNPKLALWDDLNKTALTYLRELGLTPAGLKKIMEESFRKERPAEGGNGLLDLLKKQSEE